MKHPTFFRVKHIIPSMLVGSLAILAGLALFCGLCRQVLLALLATYALFIAVGAIWLGVKNGFSKIHLLAVSLVMLHFGYGAGMIGELFRQWRIGVVRK